MTESHLITVSKAISWRFFGTAISWAATYAVTENVEISTQVSLIEVVSKIFLFYIHERIWLLNLRKYMNQKARAVCSRKADVVQTE